jgi:hypothetical protein
MGDVSLPRPFGSDQLDLLAHSCQRRTRVSGFAIFPSVSVETQLHLDTTLADSFRIMSRLPQKGGRFENGVIQMDVQSDLTPLFANWNTKQLYVSIVAEWNNTKTKVSLSKLYQAPGK